MIKSRFNKASFTIILMAALLGTGCRSTSCHQPVSLPDGAHTPAHTWAVRMDEPALPNLHRVSDDLYRGAQPTAEGFRQLKAMGVKTIINLRFFYNDQEKFFGPDFGYEEIPMNAWQAEDEDVIRFLKIVMDETRAPFFIHCEYGADRAGMMCAVYRMVIQGWTKDEAIAEMTEGGFGFHEIWQNLITYVRNMDVEDLKQKASR